MDLKSFITTTLSQIVSGVSDAQQIPSGTKIAAQAFHVPSGHNLFSEGTYGMFTVVDFDVSVFAETKEGGGTLRVAGIEQSDTLSKTAQNSSRIKFSVHIKLPTGERASSGRASSGSRYDELGDETGWIES